MKRGNNIEEWIEDPEIPIEAGWCSVVHQSTENLIIGKLIKPKIDIKEVILETLFLLSKILHDIIYKI